MKTKVGLLLTEEQEQALERAYSEEQLQIVIDYLDNRTNSFNPWLDIEGNWFNQTDQSGKPIEGEAARRLLSDASEGKTRLNSCYRLTPYDKVRYLYTNNHLGSDVWDIASYVVRNELVVVQEETGDELLVAELEATLNLFQYVKKALNAK